MPIPVVPSLAALNAHLEQRCLERLDLEVYPYLPRARVATTSPRAYLALLGEGGP